MQTRLDRLVDAIDQLVDQQLARGEPSGDLDEDRCELCSGPWHGAPTDFAAGAHDLRYPRCPGAFASDPQRDQWHRDSERQREQWQRDRERASASFRVGRCALCGGRWHAERGDPPAWTQDYRWHPKCPGAFGTDAEREQWQRYPGPKTYLSWRVWRSGIRSCTGGLTTNS